MRFAATATLVLAAAGALAACGSEEEFDTEYEQSLPSPVPADTSENAPVPDNDSIEGGADEQVDAQAAGDAVPVEPVEETA